MKCECVCDNFQRRTEVQGSLGHMNTWGLGLSAAVPRPDLWELGNKEIYFLVNLFFFPHFVTQPCSPPGFNKPFQAFFSTGPFESFQCFLNPDPRPLFVEIFSVPSSLLLLFVFHNYLASCSFLPSSFPGLFAHLRLFFLSGREKTQRIK